MRLRWGFGLAIWLFAGAWAANAQTPAPSTQTSPTLTPATQPPLRTYGISLLGAPSLPPDFKFFPYVNPDAPKGGEVALSTVGTFDSFNPFIVRGTAASDVFRVWDTLTEGQRRRGGDRVRPAGEGDRIAGRPHGRRLRIAARGEVQRRHAGHRRGRRLDLRDPARKGPPVLPAILCRCRLGDGRGAAPRGVPLQVRHSTASCR